MDSKRAVFALWRLAVDATCLPLDLCVRCADYVSDHCTSAQINKLVLPLTFKLLDDSRSEVKLKTEKLVKKLHFLVGHQLIDMCPQMKLARV